MLAFETPNTASPSAKPGNLTGIKMQEGLGMPFFDTSLKTHNLVMVGRHLQTQCLKQINSEYKS